MDPEKRQQPEYQLFKLYFGVDPVIYESLHDDEGRASLKPRGNQWILDAFDHLQRVLTKGSVSDEHKSYCADVVYAMFQIPDFKDEVFDDIEGIIGSEHFVKDLVSHNKELETLVANWK